MPSKLQILALFPCQFVISMRTEGTRPMKLCCCTMTITSSFNRKIRTRTALYHKRCPGIFLLISPSTKTVYNHHFRMYGTLANSELFCRQADGGLVFYDKFSQPHGAVVNAVIRHKAHPSHRSVSFLCAQGGEYSVKSKRAWGKIRPD